MVAAASKRRRARRRSQLHGIPVGITSITGGMFLEWANLVVTYSYVWQPPPRPPSRTRALSPRQILIF
jgi:hypothetical protein